MDLFLKELFVALERIDQSVFTCHYSFDLFDLTIEFQPLFDQFLSDNLLLVDLNLQLFVFIVFIFVEGLKLLKDDGVITLNKLL